MGIGATENFSVRHIRQHDVDRIQRLAGNFFFSVGARLGMTDDLIDSVLSSFLNLDCDNFAPTTRALLDGW